MGHLKWLALAIPLLALAGCDKPKQATPAESATPAAATPAPAPVTADAAAIEAAIANSNRMASDREEDAWRKAGDVLTYLGARPGMQVVDYLAGGGYYSELLSYVVGDQGKVIAYNNPAYQKYAAEMPAKRYGNNRLPNVAQVTTNPEEAPFEPNSLDGALFVQSYHDLHWKSKDGSWPPTDPAKSLEKLVPALKSGAVVVVVDHVAAPGSDPAVTVDALHRIDPAIVKRDFEAAGLVFDAESVVFKNAEDDHSKPVFDPAVRHKTDQVMYRFRKP